MDISADKNKSDGNQAGLMLAGWQKIRGMFRWLFGLFVLTEEDRLTAGIDISVEEREE